MKHRVGILSRHAVPNYGSIFQAFALQSALDGLGTESEYVNYRIARDYPVADAIRQSGLMGPLRAVPKVVGARKFEAIRDALLKQTRSVVDSGGLESLLCEYEVLCVGGDQVWNVMSDGRVEGAYLLEAAPDTSYKFSYASSFGGDRLALSERDRVASALAKFNRLSVREESGQRIIEEMGLKARRVVDPVHLLTKGEWIDRFSPKAPLKVADRFCLIYNLHPSVEFNEYAYRACTSLGLNVISIRPSLRRTMGRNLFYPTPAEFLWLFDNAECVLTDSFHGTAFSLLFNTPFVDILPEQYSERNTAILARYGLQSRTSVRIPPEDLALGAVDWVRVNDLLSADRVQSRSYLADTVREFCTKFGR